MSKYHWVGSKTFVDVTNVATAFVKDKTNVYIVTHTSDTTNVPFETAEEAYTELRALFTACNGVSRWVNG